MSECQYGVAIVVSAEFEVGSSELEVKVTREGVFFIYKGPGHNRGDALNF